MRTALDSRAMRSRHSSRRDSGTLQPSDDCWFEQATTEAHRLEVLPHPVQALDITQHGSAPIEFYRGLFGRPIEDHAPAGLAPLRDHGSRGISGAVGSA